MSERIICLGSLVQKGQTPQECVNCPLQDVAQQVTQRIARKLTKSSSQDALAILQGAHDETEVNGSRRRFAGEILAEAGGIAIANLAIASPRRTITQCPLVK